MASVGRETKLIKDGNVIAGVRLINVDWQSESVDISQGESDGYRLLSEIDGLTTIDIQCEGITKDHELQEIAYSRSQSRLLKNISLELPRPEGGIIELTLDLYIDSLSVNANYNDAISFNASFTGSAIIEDGQIIGIQRDETTGEISGTPGYSYNELSLDIRIKINTRNFDQPNSGEAYIHGVDSQGVDQDIDGLILYDGTNINVDRVQYVVNTQNPVWTFSLVTRRTIPANRTGVIIFDTAKQKPFEVTGLTGPTLYYGDIVSAYYDSDLSTWFYDNNSLFQAFSPTETMRVIGLIDTGEEFINSASVFYNSLPLSDFE